MTKPRHRLRRERRVRRLPGWRHFTLVCLCALIIAMAGLIASRWRHAFVNPGFVLPLALDETVRYILPPFLFILSFWEQRILRALLEVVVALAAATMAFMCWFGFSGGIFTEDEFWLVAGLFAAARLGGLTLARHLLPIRVVPDHPACSTCDYNLTGNTSGICPECGTPIPPSHSKRSSEWSCCFAN